MNFNIFLPNKNGHLGIETLTTSNNLVIIGANGAGKSKLGAWTEQRLIDEYFIHRVSAQKKLTIPDFAQVKNLEQAEKDLHLGNSNQYASVQNKINNRWKDHPTTYLLDDYHEVLSLLFAKESERDRIHTLETKKNTTIYTCYRFSY